MQGKPKKNSSSFENTQDLDIIDAYAPTQPYLNNSNNPKSNNVPKKSKKSNNNKSHKKKNPIKNFFKRLINIILAIFFIYSVVALFFISKVDNIKLDRISSENELLKSSEVKNILLIGTDGRTSEEQGRSDSMILISINSKSKEITMTSIMRDIYVYIPEYHYDKLNASYSYGGASLLLDTIEENFSIKINDCMIIDFTSFVNMVDAVGGIDITITDEEAEAINTILISEVNEIIGDDRMSDLLSSGGKYRLNGKQALSYSRIRYVGNADFERTQRQRVVVNAIIDRLKTPNIFRIGNFASTTASQITSNMNVLDMYLLSLQVPFALGYDVVQQRIPTDDTWYYDDIDGQSVIVADFDENNKYLAETIYKIND